MNGLTVDIILHPESGATLKVHRDKGVLSDPDTPCWEISPRPRPQRQKVIQARVPRRRVTVGLNRNAKAGEQKAT